MAEQGRGGQSGQAGRWPTYPHMWVDGPVGKWVTDSLSQGSGAYFKVPIMAAVAGEAMVAFIPQ